MAASNSRCQQTLSHRCRQTIENTSGSSDNSDTLCPFFLCQPRDEEYRGMAQPTNDRAEQDKHWVEDRASARVWGEGWGKMKVG
jgi:hypothetical protein